MKKILFPTDFSETSNNAFIYALKLADGINAEIVALHVFNFPIIDSNFIDLPVYQVEVYQSMELASFENFKSQIPVLEKIAASYNLSNIPISSVLLEGNLEDIILEHIEENKIDFVVMGTHGANGFGESLFGSVTASVMTGTNAIVLGIPEEAAYQPIKKLGIASQFHHDDFDALKKVLDIAEGFKANVECLYVKNEENQIDDIVMADWKLLFREDNVSFHTIESEDVEATIKGFIITHQIDMLAVLNHHRGFWENLFHTSLTKKLAFHLQVPLLVLHNN